MNPRTQNEPCRTEVVRRLIVWNGNTDSAGTSSMLFASSIITSRANSLLASYSMPSSKVTQRVSLATEFFTTALELAGHVLFDGVDETHHDGFTELT